MNFNTSGCSIAPNFEITTHRPRRFDFYQYLLQLVEIVGGWIKGKASVRLAATHANSEADASSLLESARVEFSPIETLCCPLSPVIGTHVGPGTIALNFMSGIA